MKLLRRIASVIANTKLPLEAKGVSARFARFLTDKNNPDHIIVAHILQSFATEFDQWLVKTGEGPYYTLSAEYKPLPFPTKSQGGVVYSRKCYFLLTKPGFSVAAYAEWKTEWQHTNEGNISAPEFKVFTINNIPISLDLAEGLVRSYEELRDKHIAAEKVAKEARAAMEANEKKWDIVENVLGMKRDATGLLQPKAVPCKCNRVADCYDGEGCREDA